MSTAALVTDMVLDWLKGDVSPRYMTHAVKSVEPNLGDFNYAA